MTKAYVDSDAMLQVLQAATIGDRTEIPMAHVTTSAIPGGIKAYLRASVRDRLRSALGEIPDFSRIADGSPLADRIRDVFLRHSADAYIFSREEFLPALENALHFTENYISRPRWTLRSFLFHDSYVITATELISRLDYVTDYVYLPQLLRRTIIERHVRDVDSSTCGALIRKIDTAVVREHTPRELALLARPVFEFFLLDKEHPDGSIPLRPILLFFEDKELHGLHNYLHGVCRLRNLEAITLNDLIELSEDFLSGKPPSLKAEAEPPAPSAAEELSLFAPSAEGEEVAAVPAEEPHRDEPPPAPSAPETVPPTPENDSTPPGQTPMLPPLNSMITPDLRKRFIQTLCDKDADFYDLIIARLDDLHDWKEASGYIRELFEINDIDPFHDLAVQFTDIVQRRLEDRGPASS